jgi:hypothetical protein
MKAVALVAGVIVVAVASGLGGYAIGRHGGGDSAERQTANADAQEIIGAYNREVGPDAHLVWIGKAAPHIWRFRVKFNGKKLYRCEQVNLKQFWHGEGAQFHGFGRVDAELCLPSAGA